MTTNVTSTNPVVKSIISGSAPPAARLAAARGLLPLPQADLIEALIHLSSDADTEVARAARGTLDATAERPVGRRPGRLSRRPFYTLPLPMPAGIHEAVAGNNNTLTERLPCWPNHTDAPCSGSSR